MATVWYDFQISLICNLFPNIQCFPMGIFGTLYVLVHFARYLESFYIAHIVFKTILTLVNLVFWATESVNPQNMWHLSATLCLCVIWLSFSFLVYFANLFFPQIITSLCLDSVDLVTGYFRVNWYLAWPVLGFRLPQKCFFPCNLLKFLTPMNYLMKQPVLCFSNASGL